MSTVVRNLLDAFDALPDAEQEAVVTELLARRPPDAGPVPDEAYTALADELFLTYGAAEAADAAPAR